MRVDWDALEAVVERMTSGKREVVTREPEYPDEEHDPDDNFVAWLGPLGESWDTTMMNAADAEALAAFDQNTLRALLAAVRAGEALRDLARDAAQITHVEQLDSKRHQHAAARFEDCPDACCHARKEALIAYDRATGRTVGEGE